MAAERTPVGISKTRRSPATTPEAREYQLIDLAVDLAEQQIRDGTASAQVITHFLKLGTTRERLEQEKIQYETELLRAKTESLSKGAEIEELYRNALTAMSTYSGEDGEDHSYDY